ncbi:MAG: type I 3-dehydroquinate dehydratase [Candidatus Daviesbacteria bacterium]|nr:type I 3-dehydroquinate dehydratase [Candidatus Daviesbacteria bacterium]
MKIKYCLPIIKNSKEEVLQEILQNMDSYDFFEIWLDYIDDVNKVFIKRLTDQFGEKLIVVFRRKNLEAIRMGLEKRLNIISLLKNSQLLLDLDIYGQKEELNTIKKDHLKINTIVSYHNYQETPDDGKLKAIIDTMKTYEPSIFKIATKCNYPKDALRLLGLLLAIKQKNIKCIVLGMGELGIITRIFGSLWGNEMTFAPKNKLESSASGQLTKKQLETIFRVLGIGILKG